MWIFLGLTFICIAISTRDNQCNAQSSTKGSTLPVPSIEFKCSEEGNIFDIVGDKDQYTFVDTGNYCKLSDAGCNWKNKTKIDIIYSPNENDTHILGGKDTLVFELECKGPLDFYAKANASFSVQSVKQTDLKHKTVTASTPTKTLSLTIQKGNNLVKNVKIGEELNLTLQGPNGYDVFPTDCKAYPGTSNSLKEYPLWTNATCKSSDAAVMEDMWTYSTNTANVKMFAFRFVKSDQVRIVCSAHLCPTATCTSKCNKQNSGRKKRNAELTLESKLNAIEETASATFTVVDETITPNGGAGLTISSGILVAVGCVMLMYL